MQIKEQVLLSKKTTYKIGGKSNFFVEPTNLDEIKEVIIWANDNSQNIFILGKGSNVLISDAGWEGITISLAKLDYVNWNDNHIVCGAGLLLHNLVIQTVERGLHGIEALAGIPGTVGGGIVMNAGAFGGNISDCLVEVKMIDMKNQNIFTYKKEEMEFGYRTSILKRKNWIVVEAAFDFKKVNESDKVREVFQDILKKRTKKQPLNLPNCGSVFKRPENNYAGTLIEKCGLKGFTVGGASVSDKHANFIVNKNHATARDVKNVIEYVQKVVYEKTGIMLEREVIYIGDNE